LKDKGMIQFRTDHLDLFNDSIEHIKEFFHIIDIQNNLSESNYMTEYEIRKRQEGPIYQLIGRVQKDAS
jgi:tRNA (guanine-N7-)-methyltransferase